jgi:UDP-glucose 4-epimerase
MKYMVTGGAGFVGSHIARALVRRNPADEVVVYDDLSVGVRENVPEECVFVNGDIRDREKLDEAMKGVDVVFHDAAFVSIRNSYLEPGREIEINEIGTLNVFEAMRATGARRMVFASSMAVFGYPIPGKPFDEEYRISPISPYGVSKMKGEQFCEIYREHYGIEYAALRYFNIFGTGQGYSPYVGVLTAFINQSMAGGPITVYGDGRQSRDFVSVDDIAQANLLAADAEGSGIYCIASGDEQDVITLAERVSEQFGGVEIVFEPKPGGEVDVSSADISKAVRELGYKPTKTILSELPAIVEWWKSKGGEPA